MFLPYDWCDIFEAIHNGACVYECYAELMKIHWTDVAKKVLLFRGKDLKTSMFVIPLTSYKYIFDFDFVVVVLGHTPCAETLDILESLAEDEILERLDPAVNRNATLARKSYANTEIDCLISTAYKIPVMIFGDCSNGGGFAMNFNYGMHHYATCKLNYNAFK